MNDIPPSYLGDQQLEGYEYHVSRYRNRIRRQVRPDMSGLDGDIMRSMYERLGIDKLVYEDQSGSSDDSSIYELVSSDPESDDSVDDLRDDANEVHFKAMQDVAKHEMLGRVVAEQIGLHYKQTLLIKEPFGKTTYDPIQREASEVKEHIKAVAKAAEEEETMQRNVELSFLESNIDNLGAIEQKLQTLEVANALEGGISALEDAKMAQADWDRVSPQEQENKNDMQDESKQQQKEQSLPIETV